MWHSIPQDLEHRFFFIIQEYFPPQRHDCLFSSYLGNKKSVWQILCKVLHPATLTLLTINDAVMFCADNQRGIIVDVIDSPSQINRTSVRFLTSNKIDCSALTASSFRVLTSNYVFFFLFCFVSFT